MTIEAQITDKELPNLPGYRVNLPPLVQGLPCEKPQTLYWLDGKPVIAPKPLSRSPNAQAADLPVKTRRSAGAETLLTSPSSTAAAVERESLLGWLKHSGEVLRFTAYFTEQVDFSPAEKLRVRSVNILHYLEDETTQVVEPRKDSEDGMFPGVLVKRMRLPATGKVEVGTVDSLTTPAYLGAFDFAVGQPVTINGRVIHIIDADAFTRSYMEAHGHEMAPSMPLPSSPYQEYIAQKSKPSGLSRADPQSPTRFAEILMGRDPGTKKLQQFLGLNSKVLRYFAIFDDEVSKAPGSSKPARRHYKIHYYLEDDTMEIIEVKNGKEEIYSRFLARGLLPKHHSKAGLALGNTLNKEDCISPADLRIGGSLCVHGRSFFIHDADEFTKRYAVESLGACSEELTPIDVSLPAPPAVVKEIPPYNGYGDPEDSAHNSRKLVPSNPKPVIRTLASEAGPSNCAALRFAACLLDRPGRQPLTSADRARRFVLSFFLADGTLAVYEPPVPNSGIMGGKFLERCKACKAGGQRISEQDLYIGVELDLHGRLFELTDADQWTLKTMEKEPKLFPKANGEAASLKIRSALTAMKNTNSEGAERVEKALKAASEGTIDDFFTVLRQLVPAAALTKHEAIAVHRLTAADKN